MKHAAKSTLKKTAKIAGRKAPTGEFRHRDLKAGSLRTSSLPKTVSASEILEALKKIGYSSSESKPVTISVGFNVFKVPHHSKMIRQIAEVVRADEAGIDLNEEYISTNEAASLLNVSRPFVIKLLDGGKIPSRNVGTRRQAKRGDVLKYKKAMERKQRDALDEMAADSQEDGMPF